MAAITSMKILKIRKAPSLTAPKPVWDNWEKETRERRAHNKRVLAEKERRKKERSKRS